MRVVGGLVVAMATVGLVGERAGAAPAPKVASQVRLEISDARTVWSEPVTLTVRVTGDPAVPPTGPLTLLLDGTKVGSARLTGPDRGTVNVTSAQVPVGRHQITVRYVGDARHAGATGDEISLRVGPARTTTTLTSPTPSVETGAAATFVARVAPVAPATAVPQGVVTFRTGGLEERVRLAGATATWRPVLPDGLHHIGADFRETSRWGPSETTLLDQRIGPAPVPAVDQAVTSRSGETMFITPGGSFPAAAQVFTAGTTGTITAVELDHVCLGGGMPGPGYLEVPISIKALSGGSPTGAVLGSGATATGYDEATGLTRVDLTTPAPVTAGTSYAIVLPAPQGGLGCQLGLAADGQSLLQLGSTWTPLTTSLRYKTWVLRP